MDFEFFALRQVLAKQALGTFLLMPRIYGSNKDKNITNQTTLK